MFSLIPDIFNLLSTLKHNQLIFEYFVELKGFGAATRYFQFENCLTRRCAVFV